MRNMCDVVTLMARARRMRVYVDDGDDGTITLAVRDAMTMIYAGYQA